MSKLKPTIGDIEKKVVAELCAVSGNPLQTGAIEYKLGTGFYIKVNPGQTITSKRLTELKSSVSAKKTNVKGKSE